MKCSYPIADHEIYQFVMPVIRSNMYVLPYRGAALVVDPCVSPEAEQLLREEKVKSCTVLLTHEHYDHISGVNRLRELFECWVICSRICNRLINNPRTNAAVFFAALFLGRDEQERNQIEALLDTGYCCSADKVYEGELRMDWEGLSVWMKELPGHSKGSQIIQIEGKSIFTGDSLIPDTEPITRLPGGSRKDYEEIAKPYLLHLPEDSVIYPGHGAVVPFISSGIHHNVGQLGNTNKRGGNVL